MTHWFQEMAKYHPALLGYIAAAFINCAVTSLPTPEPNGKGFGSKLYQWIFNTSHGLVLAIPRIVSQYKQDAPKP